MASVLRSHAFSFFAFPLSEKIFNVFVVITRIGKILSSQIELRE